MRIPTLGFFRKPPPEVEPITPPGRFALLQEAVLERIPVRRAQAAWEDLQSVEDYWPLVLPLLAWVAWRTYRSERRKGSVKI